jgi:hypothetical protein
MASAIMMVQRVPTTSVFVLSQQCCLSLVHLTKSQRQSLYYDSYILRSQNHKNYGTIIIAHLKTEKERDYQN